MLKNERYNLYKLAISTYGEYKQTLVAVEEMSELTKELCKRYRGKQSLEDISEEIADVSIMLEQLVLMYKVDGLVEKYKQEKLDRLAKRLSGAPRTEKKSRLTKTQVAVVKAFADENMSLTNTAKALNYTRNNIEYHVKKIYERTDLDPRNFHDLNQLLFICQEG